VETEAKGMSRWKLRHDSTSDIRDIGESSGMRLLHKGFAETACECSSTHLVISIGQMQGLDRVIVSGKVDFLYALRKSGCPE
jgi:hypothetical protein